MTVIVTWIIVAAVARIAAGSWWAPGSLLALVMSVSAVGTTTFAPEYYQSLNANLYLQIATISCVLGGVIGTSIGRQKSATVSFAIKRGRSMLALGYASSSLALLTTLSALGAGVGDLISPARLISVAQRATRQRYVTGIDLPIYVNLANALFLCYAMIVAADAVAARRIRFRYVGPFIISIASDMVITTRAPILFLLILVIFSAVYADRFSNGSDKFRSMFSARYIRLFLVVGVVMVSIFFYFQTLRFGAESQRTSGEVWSHLRKYPWGSLPGFSLWFDGKVPSEVEQPPGFYTFMGIYDILGISDRVQGGYSVYYRLTGDEPGNIYTAFRGFMHDFGAIGALVVGALLGLLGSMAMTGRAFSQRVGMAIYVGVSSTVAFSFVVSFVSFTSNLIALLMLPVVMGYMNGSEPDTDVRLPRGEEGMIK